MWLRDFLRTYAASGASVLISSHLLAEIEAVADRVVVIGHGELIADDTLESFIDEFGLSTIQVRTDEPTRLRPALEDAGGLVDEARGDMLLVSGLDQRRVAQIAPAATCFVYELMTSTDDLEQSCLRASHGQAAHVAAGTASVASAPAAVEEELVR